MSNENIDDVKNFKERLSATVYGFGKEGERIGEYLKHVVPDWESMNDTRLYSHIQHMLDKAEEIRRFEIDLVWKRAIYFVPLMVIFFTAFIGVFYLIYDTNYNAYGMEIERDSNEEDFLFFVLFLIASANAFLSFCLAKMNVASHRWQKNWEYHVEYLQTILGVKMIRVKLPKNTEPFTVRKTNILISVFIFTVWIFIILICLLNPLNFLILELGFRNFLLESIPSNHLKWIGIILLLVGGFLTLFFLIFRFYRCIAREPFCKPYGTTHEADEKKDIVIGDLQLFSYKRESEVLSKKDKWWCVLCHCCAEDQSEKQSHQKSKVKNEVSKKGKAKKAKAKAKRGKAKKSKVKENI